MNLSPNINQYNTIVFDCDGVILDSNKVKTLAFYTAALPWGRNAANELIDFHIKHGGISRYIKFDYFLRNIVGKEPDKIDLQMLLDCYSNEVRKGLRTCPIAQGMEALRMNNPIARWLVVSGGDQNELRDVFSERKIDRFFDGGIFGSPDTKSEILLREISNNNIRLPALFFGDSRYDHEAASQAGLAFVFVSGWSEFSDWQVYTKNHSIPVINSLFTMFATRIR